MCIHDVIYLPKINALLVEHHDGSLITPSHLGSNATLTSSLISNVKQWFFFFTSLEDEA